MSWAAGEFADLDLGDKRLDRRAVKLAEAFAGKPMASIPQACGGWTETQAAYRFFGSEEFDWQDILAPHFASTHKRMAEHPVVLCIQDTTELDFNGQDIEGLGRLNYAPQRGMYLHPTYAVSVDREPLGVLDAWMWTRAPKGSKADREALLESTRWVEGYERVAEQAALLPATRLVYVADREGDLLPLMRKAQALGHPADWLVRSQHNRKLMVPVEAKISAKDRKKAQKAAEKAGTAAKSAEAEDASAKLVRLKMWDETKQGTPLGEVKFVMPRRPGHQARTVHQTLWAKRVEVARGLWVSCVVARELHPPAGVKALEWRLVSNREVKDFADASELVDWYRARWEIEMLFDVLKNGCRIEALQLSSVDRLERALALYLVVAWRIARLMRLGRTCPELPAELYFDADEWRGAYILLKKPLPKTPPGLNKVIRMIATLGGFLGRKSDGEPGVKTLWLGLQRISDFASGIRHARELGLV